MRIGVSVIKLGLPKGRMASESDRICDALGVKTRAGMLKYTTITCGVPVSIYLMKAPDIARLLVKNLLDLGLTGDEWLMETGVSPGRRCFETRSYEAFVCLLMARDAFRPFSDIRSVVTPYPNLARSLLGDLASRSEIMAISGSSEAMVPDMADACIDVVETGTSAALNSLVIRRSFTHVTTHMVRSARCDSTAVAPVVELLADARGLAR
jgi:ATP phosphoribosyltransferase